MRFHDNGWTAIGLLANRSGAEFSQSDQQVLHRPLPHPRDAVEPISALSQADERREESHAGTGVSQEQVCSVPRDRGRGAVNWLAHPSFGSPIYMDVRRFLAPFRSDHKSQL